MGYLHALITLLSAVVFFILGLPAGLVILITGLFSKAAAERMSYAFVRFGLRLVSAVSGSRVTVQGWENIPKDRPVLFVANHRSIFDVILFFPKLPTEMPANRFSPVPSKQLSCRVYGFHHNFLSLQFLKFCKYHNPLLVTLQWSDFRRSFLRKPFSRNRFLTAEKSCTIQAAAMSGRLQQQDCKNLPKSN